MTDRSYGDARPFSPPPSPDRTVPEGIGGGWGERFPSSPRLWRRGVIPLAVMAARVGRAFRSSGHMLSAGRQAGISKGSGRAGQAARGCVACVASMFSRRSLMRRRGLRRCVVVNRASASIRALLCAFLSRTLSPCNDGKRRIRAGCCCGPLSCKTLQQ